MQLTAGYVIKSSPNSPTQPVFIVLNMLSCKQKTDMAAKLKKRGDKI